MGVDGSSHGALPGAGGQAEDRTGSDSPRAPEIERWLALGVALAGSLLLLLPVVLADLPFFADDYVAVANLLDEHGELDAGAMLRTFVAPRGGMHYRPVNDLSFALESVLVGSRPRLYYVMNALYHGIVSWLLFVLLVGLGAGRRWSWATLLLFLVHPVHIEACAWIVARTSTLGAAGLLGALVCFLRYRRRPGPLPLVGLLLLTALGLGCREDVAVLPLVLLLVDLLLRPGAAAGLFRWLLPHALAGLVVLAWLVVVRHVGAVSSEGWLDTVQSLAEPSVRGHLLASLGRPLVPWVASLVESPSPGLAILVALPSSVLLLTGLLALRQPGPRRIWLFGLGLLVIACLPLAPVMRVGADLSNSRGLYLPSVGWCVLLGAAARAAGRGSAAWLRLPARLAIAAGVLGGAALLLFNQQAYLRAGRVWHDFLAAVRSSGASVLVVPTAGGLAYADRQGDGARDDGGALFRPLDDEAAAAADGGPGDVPGLALVLNVPRIVHGVFVFWGDLRFALGPNLGGPGVDVLSPDLAFGLPEADRLAAGFVARLLADGVRVLKWDGQALRPSRVETITAVSLLQPGLVDAQVPLLEPATGGTHQGSAVLSLRRPGGEVSSFRWSILSAWGIQHLPASPVSEGEWLDFDPWDDPACGALLRAASGRFADLPASATRGRTSLPCVLYLEALDAAGSVVGRSAPCLWRLPRG